MDLFDTLDKSNQLSNGLTDQPLAEQLRPKSLAEFLGQQRVIGPTSLLSSLLAKQEWIPNLIFWGPPGTGKTTLAQILASVLPCQFLQVNAVDTGSKQIKLMGEQARYRRLQSNERTLIFIDEIHRLNRAQQDVLLPFTEKGDFTLIGATTENPGYELNTALLSRCRVLVFEGLTTANLRLLLDRAVAKFGYTSPQIFSVTALELLLTWCDGDGRRLLNQLEQILKSLAFVAPGEPLTEGQLREVLERPPGAYDKVGDEHYDCISAFIKSVRGSDPDAAIYYLARMLTGGEDPLFIARRLVILASEDIGNADPRGLSVAVSGFQAVELIGLPEGAITLAQVTTYLASAPKSNRSYAALNQAKAVVEKTGRLPIPKSLRSAQSAFARGLGHGQNYRYAHTGAKGWEKMEFLPEAIAHEKFYEPVERGFEKTIRQYLAWVKDLPIKTDSENQ